MSRSSNIHKFRTLDRWVDMIKKGFGTPRLVSYSTIRKKR